MKYLGMKEAIKELPQSAEYDVVLGCLDVKDAFLQVEQEKPILVHIQGCPYVIKRNLPGQRLGAKQWYQHLRSYLTTMFNYEWCSEQPCMARNENSVILIHVDDILYVGRKTYWQDFLNGMKEKFSVAHSQLEGNGSNVCFLRRKITEVEGGLIMTPGTSVSKVVKSFEEKFGVARVQRVPCSTDIQLADKSPQLNARDGKAFRSIVELCLDVGRERPDLMFTIKELASAMSCPTVTSLQRLRKMVGYMKFVGDVGVRLQAPIPRQGKHLDGS